MSTLTDPPPSESFRLSQLIYDTRYRSLTIQVVAFMLIMLGLSWLVSNTVQNLQALGKDIDFGFLGQPAGYDIGQRLVPYDSQATHARAAFVGILNTLLVAVLGCALATVLGVTVGVLRLSKNWIVARLMSVYVEGFRNIPTLLWILLVFAIFSEGLPHPSTFRPDAETGQAESTMLFGSIAMTRQGSFIPRLVYADGAILFVIAIVLALIGIWALRRMAHRRQDATGETMPVLIPSVAILLSALIAANLIISAGSRSNELSLVAVGAEDGMSLAEFSGAAGRIDFCRIRGSGGSFSTQNLLDEREISYRAREFFGDRDSARGLARGECVMIAVPASEAAAFAAELTPELRGDAVAVVLSDTVLEGPAVQVEVPEITESGIARFEGGIPLRNPLIALWLALSLYTSAFIAENVRSGILAVSRGQTEAAFALGLRPNRTMSLVILPQALRVIVPPLISQYLNLTKNSSLALAVGYMDVRSTLGGITINQTGRELEGMLLLGGFYLVTSLIISGAMNVYNQSIKLKER